RRDRAVGFLNPVVSLGFRLMPGVYDRLVAPLMTRLALGTTPVADHPGNLFEPQPEPEPAKDRT
ncbi:MAG TPA: hypothetical protein VNS46_02000, partial [Nocardioides sp.]|nr:hypothetical protein [Nocardioides sp.]